MAMPESMAWTLLFLAGMWIIGKLLEAYQLRLNRKIKGLAPEWCPYCGHEKKKRQGPLNQ
jgi:hypothetical protein|tara:strand:+ start:351 stop:530 length:180 start_codon:yes stop_codon:yes gene_type:complete